METNEYKQETLIGSIVAGRYQLVKHLATGSMGVVFLALDKKLGDIQVAIKILHSKFLSDDVVYKRFANEVVFARKLNHPNIVRIYDFDESSQGQRVISMEYVDGPTFCSVIKECHGPVLYDNPPSSALYEVDFKRLLEIYKKLLAGVSFAHEKGILHRDLKPSNVLIDSNDEPKIVDFGLATVAGVSSGLTTDGGSLIGTPDYMAPEQVLGHRMSARSDIYSLGMIAFELLFGRTAFIAESPLAVAYMQAQTPFPSLANIPNFVPRNFTYLIKRSTHKNPHERFSSVEEMIECLEERPNPGAISEKTVYSSGSKKLKSPDKHSFGEKPASFGARYPKFYAILKLWVLLGFGALFFLVTSVFIANKTGQNIFP